MCRRISNGHWAGRPTIVDFRIKQALSVKRYYRCNIISDGQTEIWGEIAWDSKFMWSINFNPSNTRAQLLCPSGGNESSSAVERGQHHGAHTLISSHWAADQRHSRGSSKSTLENRNCDLSFPTMKPHQLQFSSFAQMKTHYHHLFRGENVTSSTEFYLRRGASPTHNNSI